MPIIYDQNGQVLFNSDNPGVVKISNDDNNPIPADILDRAERELGVVSADNLDIALSDLQNAIAGAGAAAKTLADLATLLTSLSGKNFATEATLEAARVILASVNAKDFATQTTATQILAKIISAPATEAKQDALATLVGALNATPVTDPTLSASEIALLKGILKQLQGNGTGTLPVNVAGGVTIDGDTTLAGTVIMRDATDPAKLAKVNADGSQVMQLSGSNAQGLVNTVILNPGVLAAGASYETARYDASLSPRSRQYTVATVVSTVRTYGIREILYSEVSGGADMRTTIILASASQGKIVTDRIDIDGQYMTIKITNGEATDQAFSTLRIAFWA